MQLALVDEVLAEDAPEAALALMDAAYPMDRLNSDEDFRRPSEDFQVRATLLHAHFLRLKERQGSRWHSYYDDLLVILKAASVRGSDKQALAQQLVLDDPAGSLGKIASSSKEHGELKFDQSCLSQWIQARIVIDPYADNRPSFGPGTDRSGVPENRCDLPPERRGNTQ
jgi:hypothetical protein